MESHNRTPTAPQGNAVLSKCLAALYRHWRLHSLREKLLVPIVGLMLLSLLTSTLAFVVGTALTQNQLLEQQTTAEAEQVRDTLGTRASMVSAAATILAADPQVISALQNPDADSLQTLNSRAVVMRDRFSLDLIQIYNQQGEPRTNLVVSSLYRESSLLGLLQGQPQAVVAVDGRLLLLAQSSVDGAKGTVLVGIDLDSELRRVAATYRLSSDFGLKFTEGQVATQPEFSFDAPDGRNGGFYSRRFSLTLAQTEGELALMRSTTEVAHVTTTGLTVMVASTLLTTVLLTLLSFLVTRSIAEPIHRLSASAALVAKGDLSPQVEIGGLSYSNMGDEDEISLLASNFNSMVAELRDLYGNLEANVLARTQELAISAEVAKAVSSTLDLDIVLTRSVRIIRERLGFLHAAVFIIEPGANMAVLHAAAGEGIEALKEEGFQLPVGSRSMVGVAAVTGKPRISQNVTGEAVYFRVAQLSDAGAAAAIPLLTGKTVLGILYVQSEHPDSLNRELMALLVTLADQIAVGVKNAQLYGQQREAAERLAEMDRIKTEFLANMSHELRTPLNSIIGFSKVMLKGLEGPLTEMQAQELHIIYDSGQHLLGLINDILDVSKLNAGKMRLQFEEVDMGALVESALATASALVREKPISLRAEVAPHLSSVYVDLRRVRQILLNLLSNAAKFTESGEIVVFVREIEALNAHTERLEPFIQITVKDTGIGIPQDKLADIFKQFSQIDGSTARRVGGTGLGLSITKGLVELHGGQIWVDSQPNQGSSFSFTLPRVPTETEKEIPVDQWQAASIHQAV